MKKLLVNALLTFLIIHAHAQTDWSSGRPDGHAPIAVMGDHTHGKGEWMISYRYMHMKMNGLRDGSSDVSKMTAYNSYMMVPDNMSMEMHMVGIMYAFTDKLTLMAMGNHTTLSMGTNMMMMAMETTGKTESSSFGDMKISGLYKFFNKSGQRIHANFSVSIPTGSIDQKDVTLMSSPNPTQLPYAMQTGSGTWDILPGITYLGQSGNISWGAQAAATLRLGENDRNYTFGNQATMLGWGAYKFTSWLSLSAKAKASTTGKISGHDPAYPSPMMAPTLNPDNYGGEIVYGSIGANFYIPQGAFKNIRIGIEYTNPLFQNTNGLMLKTNRSLTTGIQYSW